MTSSWTDNIVGAEESDPTQFAWQDFARLKVNSQNCWKIVNHRTVERVPSPYKNNNMKLDGFHDKTADNNNSSKENIWFAASKAVSDSEEEKVVSTTKSTLTSTHKPTKSAVKTRTKKGLRVQFHENVQLLTTENENRPTIQRLQSCSLHKAHEREHLPRLQGNRSQSARTKSNSCSQTAHDHTALYKRVHVDGRSMPRVNSNRIQVFQRFLPQGSLSDYIDVDSAAIEIVQNFNDPSRGVYVDTISNDLY